MENLPSISIIIPTLNSAKTLKQTLASIAKQNYPKNKLEIIIADADSKDKTLAIARQYSTKIFPNPLKTGEAGKAVGVKKAKNDLIALIDSDNILPEKNWLQKMVEPFQNQQIFGSEPIEYTWRRSDGFITRYSALMGMNDPLCYFLGNYDRINLISGRWTNLKIKSEDKDGWFKITLKKGALPTIGANGTILKRKTLAKLLGNDKYLFDIDIIAQLIQKQDRVYFAKTKVGIVHLFCGNNIKKFWRKQSRRIKDFLYYQSTGLRKYPWQEQNKKGLIKFILYTIFILPLLGQSILGFFKKPDFAWFFHPLACWITLLAYGSGRIQAVFIKRIASRQGWKQ